MRAVFVRQVNQVFAELQNSKTEVSHDGLYVSGFPFRLKASMNNIMVRDDWALVLTQLTARSSPASPLSWSMRHRGNIRADVRSPDGTRYMFDIEPARFDLAAKANLMGVLKKLRYRGDQFRLQSLIGAVPALQSAGPAEIDFRKRGADGHLHLKAHNIVIAPQILGPLGGVFGGTIEGASFKGQFSKWTELQKKGFAQWSSATQTITIEDGEMLWGRLDVKFNADLETVRGFPQGIISLHIKRPGLLLGAAVENGLLPEPQQAQIAAFLSAIDTDADGRKTVQLSLTDRRLKYGFIPLYEFR